MSAVLTRENADIDKLGRRSKANSIRRRADGNCPGAVRRAAPRVGLGGQVEREMTMETLTMEPKRQLAPRRRPPSEAAQGGAAEPDTAYGFPVRRAVLLRHVRVVADHQEVVLSFQQTNLVDPPTWGPGQLPYGGGRSGVRPGLAQHPGLHPAGAAVRLRGAVRRRDRPQRTAARAGLPPLRRLPAGDAAADRRSCFLSTGSTARAPDCSTRSSTSSACRPSPGSTPPTPRSSPSSSSPG